MAAIINGKLVPIRNRSIWLDVPKKDASITWFKKLTRVTEIDNDVTKKDDLTKFNDLY